MKLMGNLELSNGSLKTINLNLEIKIMIFVSSGHLNYLNPSCGSPSQKIDVFSAEKHGETRRKVKRFQS